MNTNVKNITYSILKIIVILSAFFGISLAVHTYFNMTALIPTIFVLAVFLVSLSTDGYFYGIVAALVSVLTVNFAFTFPYFSFNFTIFENTVSAVILIIVTCATSALTTKIRKLEKIRLQAEKEKMRANLLRSISHDLRTPLTNIYGSASTVCENYDALSDEKIIDITEGIKKDSEWLIRMVENLLSVTRIDNSSVKLVKNPVVLEELVDSVISKLKKRYPHQSIDLNIPDEFIMVSADAILIEQVILNLLENAVQHATGMTELKLSVRQDGKLVVFEVEDDGCGVSKEKLKNIFSVSIADDSYVSDGHKRNMGIGLSVCYAIVKAHGSSISASVKRSGGMVFSFSLESEEVYDEQ